LDGVLDRIQGALFGAQTGGDREDRAVILGRRDLQASVHAVLRDVQLAAGRVQVLQRNEGADVRIDAVSHFGCPFVFDMSDAILAIRSVLLGFLLSKDDATNRSRGSG
jgi:hypothetical protein